MAERKKVNWCGVRGGVRGRKGGGGVYVRRATAMNPQGKIMLLEAQRARLYTNMHQAKVEQSCSLYNDFTKC